MKNGKGENVAGKRGGRLDKIRRRRMKIKQQLRRRKKGSLRLKISDNRTYTVGWVRLQPR